MCSLPCRNPLVFLGHRRRSSVGRVILLQLSCCVSERREGEREGGREGERERERKREREICEKWQQKSGFRTSPKFAFCLVLISKHTASHKSPYDTKSDLKRPVPSSLSLFSPCCRMSSMRYGLVLLKTGLVTKILNRCVSIL